MCLVALLPPPVQAQEHELLELPLSMIDTLTEPVGTVDFQPIDFAANQAGFSRADGERLAALAGRLRQMPVYVLIESFTDPSGTEAYNLKLSQLRAEQVKAQLIDPGGMHPTQIVVKAYGENHDFGVDARQIRLQILKPVEQGQPNSYYYAELTKLGVRFEQDEPEATVQPELAPVQEPVVEPFWLRLAAEPSYNYDYADDNRSLGSIGLGFGLRTPWTIFDRQLDVAISYLEASQQQLRQQFINLRLAIGEPLFDAPAVRVSGWLGVALSQRVSTELGVDVDEPAPDAALNRVAATDQDGLAPGLTGEIRFTSKFGKKVAMPFGSVLLQVEARRILFGLSLGLARDL